MLQSQSRVVTIFGLQAAGISDVEQFLQAHHAAGMSKLCKLNEVSDFAAFIRQVREIADRNPEQETWVLADMYCAWTMDWVREAKRLLGSSKRFEKVHIVFLSDARQTFTLVRADLDVVDKLNGEGITILQLKPWHPSMLRRWLSDCELENTRQVVEMITETTGNWPSLLYRLYRNAVKNPHQLRQRIREFRQEMLRKETLDDILPEFGIIREEDFQVFKVLSLGKARPDEIAGFCEMPVEAVRPVLAASELLGTVRHVGKDVWQADDVVAQLMQEVGDSR